MAGYETYSLIVYRRQNAKKCNGCSGWDGLQRLRGKAKNKPTKVQNAMNHILPIKHDPM